MTTTARIPSTSTGVDMEAILAAHDEVFYATFPDARPSPRSAQVEAEHARIFAPRELKPFVAAPPLQLGFGVGFGLPLAGAEYAYPDPGESWAFYAPQVQPQSSAGAGDNAGYCEDGGEQQQQSAAPRLALTMAPMAGAMALSRAHYADAHAQSPISPVPASAVSTSASTSFASPVSSSFAGSPASAPSSFDASSFDTNTTINTDININNIDINTNCATTNDGYDDGSPPPSAVSSYADSLSHSPTEYVPMASLPPPPYAYPPYPQAYNHPHMQPIPPHSHLHPLPLAPHFPHLQAPPPLPYLPPHTHPLPSHSMDTMLPPHLPQPPHLTTAHPHSMSLNAHGSLNAHEMHTRLHHPSSHPHPAPPLPNPRPHPHMLNTAQAYPHGPTRHPSRTRLPPAAPKRRVGYYPASPLPSMLSAAATTSASGPTAEVKHEEEEGEEEEGDGDGDANENERDEDADGEEPEDEMEGEDDEEFEPDLDLDEPGSPTRRRRRRSQSSHSLSASASASASLSPSASPSRERGRDRSNTRKERDGEEREGGRPGKKAKLAHGHGKDKEGEGKGKEGKEGKEKVRCILLVFSFSSCFWRGGAARRVSSQSVLCAVHSALRVARLRTSLPLPSPGLCVHFRLRLHLPRLSSFVSRPSARPSFSSPPSWSYVLSLPSSLYRSSFFSLILYPL
ncbi:hypothetical protein C8R47DRAFT_91860 [Mycena vitilis]|nr:hypothetical protein C8R47DRAFT_91860 [Mycena vitilis]